MKQYLRQVIEDTNSGDKCPVATLEEIRDAVPAETILEAWHGAILTLFMEVGDTAYNREGYHKTINLVENYLISR